MYKLPLSGGCQCGAIRYQLTEKPLTFYLCHCKDCQKQSSSAFGLSLWSSQSGFELLSGSLTFFHTAGESGQAKHCTFCNQCGTRIYHCSGNADDQYSIKAGSIDSLKGLNPIAHIWTRSAQPWAISEQDRRPRYETEPPDDATLISLWNNTYPEK